MFDQLIECLDKHPSIQTFGFRIYDTSHQHLNRVLDYLYGPDCRVANLETCLMPQTESSSIRRDSIKSLAISIPWNSIDHFESDSFSTSVKRFDTMDRVLDHITIVIEDGSRWDRDKCRSYSLDMDQDRNGEQYPVEEDIDLLIHALENNDKLTKFTFPYSWRTNMMDRSLLNRLIKCINDHPTIQNTFPHLVV
ncbi:hypothetical protein SAMD00019534_001850 [Acytostelium subglobosum LB1]|uniref:hypothetical protein n=1 Tax=Acytostelium subglobosum LB1 TaxID=1410327 RepID=UPI0006448050|nr:hypothetical protein SAMD00019534_001850 [Acytostelium subglobosum LB1]GAM17010.1 hypothetical protein SAMD00019534_001850 [Acytostelium subglobosum LB1]|eukprot:XP_012759072.1 hypothetical protein SAMD00019534_001850 [Acytostelium subglobosum LB1]